MADENQAYNPSPDRPRTRPWNVLNLNLAREWATAHEENRLYSTLACLYSTLACHATVRAQDLHSGLSAAGLQSSSFKHKCFREGVSSCVGRLRCARPKMHAAGAGQSCKVDGKSWAGCALAADAAAWCALWPSADQSRAEGLCSSGFYDLSLLVAQNATTKPCSPCCLNKTTPTSTPEIKPSPFIINASNQPPSPRERPS